MRAYEITEDASVFLDPQSRIYAAHGNGPAPQTERDKNPVGDQEAQGEIIAEEAAYETSRAEDLVQPGDVLLDGVS